MKIIGLKNENLQYAFYKLSGKVSISFPKDLKSSEVLLCQTLSSYKEVAFEINKRQLQYKIIMFLDYIKILNTIKGIQILESLPDSFIPYIKDKCTFDVPNIRIVKDILIEDKIDEYEKGSFFTKIVYPLIYKGIKDITRKKEITYSICLSILQVLKEGEPDILKFERILKQKYLKQFLEWLKTDEAKKVCECVLTKEIRYDFDNFEINYLINVLEKGN